MLNGGGVRRSNVLRSAALRVDVLSLLVEIDDTVAVWESDGKGTVDGLHLLTGRGWRPQDRSLIYDYAAQLQRWTVNATEPLGPQPRGSTCTARRARAAEPATPTAITMRASRRAYRRCGCRSRAVSVGVRRVLAAGAVRVAGAVVGL